MRGSTEYQELAERFGVEFKSTELYLQAFTSKMFHENIDQDMPHNGVLEFLGDAAIRFTVARYLTENASAMAEGTLTEIISEVVSGRNLTAISLKLELHRFANLDAKEVSDIAKGNYWGKKLMCDFLEALIGAIVSEHGLEGMQTFLATFLFPLCDELMVTDRRDRVSPRVIFDELLREKLQKNPRYANFRRRRLPGENKDIWVSEIHLGTRIFGRGSGETLKAAEVAAALNGLQRHFSQEMQQK